MPHPISVEQIARVRAAVRRHGERSADRQAELERLVTATEVGARQVSAALSRPTTVTRDCVDQLCAALRAQSRRARAAVTLTRHLCIGAREDCLADRRLLSELGEDPAERTPETPYTSRSVLVVDDYEDSRELLSLVLHDAGFTVRTASNGIEAIIAAYEMRPAVIVMDVTMPVLDGIEATRLIRSIDVLRHARVIAYTAQAAPEQPAAQLFTAVMRKPAPVDALVTMVRRYSDPRCR